MKIFLTNLGKYNEGELVGKWVELPIDEDELEEHLEDIGVTPDGKYEEYFITDVDNEEDYPIKVEEYSNIMDISDKVESLNGCDKTELEIIDLLINSRGLTLDEAIKEADCVSYIYLNDEDNSDYGLADAFIGQVYGGVSELNRETLEKYFDYESFGNDLKNDFTVGNSLAISDY